MFQDITFLVIWPNGSELENESEKVVDILKKNNAKFIEKRCDDSSLNYLDGKNTERITHIISRTVEFIEYKVAARCMIPITTPEWLFDSLDKGKLLNTKGYNPDPKYFMKDCFICVADNLPVGDKDAIYEGVTAFGGQCLDDLTKYTTHLIALDTTNEKSIIAYSATKNSVEDDKIDIQIVSPEWIYDCFKYGKNLNSEPYLITDSHNSTEQEELDQQNNTLLLNKSFFISQDYNLSEAFKKTITYLIEKNGGKVVSKFSPKSVDVYVGKYRDGSYYEMSAKSQNIIIGNLIWLYFIIIQNQWVSPVDSSVLHYPFPKEPLQDFKSLRISVTNYSGDARSYISKIISLLGGSFTKTLTRDNDYLIAAKAKGKKFDAAKTKWSTASGEGIKIVNHVWIEDCYVNWKKMDANDTIYTVSETSNERLLGFCRLKIPIGDSKLVKLAVDPVDIDDSMEEYADQLNNDLISSSYKKDEISSCRDMSTNKVNGSIAETMENNVEVENEIQKSLNQKDVYEDDNSTTEEALQVDRSQNPEALFVERNIEITHQKEIDPKKMNVDQISINSIKSTADDQGTNSTDKSMPNGLLNKDSGGDKLILKTPARGGRSAAKKAALKLQNDISDLNEYQNSIKSSKSKKGNGEIFEINDLKRKIEGADDLETPTKRPRASESTPKIIAIMTGCDPELTLSKTDLLKLSGVGIKILSDFSSKGQINTLIAPKLSRTEKFLKSLSKVNRIIHPRYISEILKKDNLIDLSWKDISKEFNIDDYSIDKCISIKELSSSLGFKGFTVNLHKILHSAQKGKLFNKIKLNLSPNLNGGVEVISSILFEHGVEEVKTIKSLNSKAAIKSFVASNDGKLILIANKNKDSKLINNFKKFVPTGSVISWDWCVRSIFEMHLADFDEFYI